MGKKPKNELEKRMKRYEASYGILIPPRTYTVVRVDGKNFSKFTKNMNKPFDDDFADSMHSAAIALCEMFNPAFAFTQSDEISLVFTDFGMNSQAIFDGKVQKICSLTASRAATAFNKTLTMIKACKYEDVQDLYDSIIDGSIIVDAQFDSRVFIIPDITEVANYFVWRQKDGTRNSISMSADKFVGKAATVGKSSNEKQEMMFQNGVNWNDFPVKYKRGVIIKKETYTKNVQIEDKTVSAIRTRWTVDNETPIFTQDWDYIYNLIPSNCK